MTKSTIGPKELADLQRVYDEGIELRNKAMCAGQSLTVDILNAKLRVLRDVIEQIEQDEFERPPWWRELWAAIRLPLLRRLDRRRLSRAIEEDKP